MRRYGSLNNINPSGLNIQEDFPPHHKWVLRDCPFFILLCCTCYSIEFFFNVKFATICVREFGTENRHNTNL